MATTRFLLENGANKTARNPAGKTALEVLKEFENVNADLRKQLSQMLA